MIIDSDVFAASDGFTFVKRHQAALIQRLKSVEPVLEHLREQNVLCEFAASSSIAKGQTYRQCNCSPADLQLTRNTAA